MFFDIIIFVVGFVIGFCVAGLVFSDKYIINELAIIKFTLDNIFDWVKGSSTEIDFLCIKNGILQEGSRFYTNSNGTLTDSVNWSGIAKASSKTVGGN